MRNVDLWILTLIITNQLFEELKGRYAQGEEVPKLAKEYGITAKAIWSRFKRHGVNVHQPNVRLTLAQVEEAVRMYKTGSSYKAIAEFFSTTQSNISRRLMKYGIVYEGPSRRRMLCHVCKDNLTELNCDPAFMAASNYTCRKCGKAKRFTKHRRIKMKILSHYGAVCICCGEKQVEFLTVDHINNDGAVHKRSLGKRGNQFYRWIIKNGFPLFLRVLCWNCNCARGAYGYCPHEKAQV